MQTFLPYADFAQSAKCLDRMRLGKQRVEVLQILQALSKGEISLHCGKFRKTPWFNHPAAKMWRGYEYSLIDYGVAICDEWVSRGYRDTCRDKIADLAKVFPNSSQMSPAFIGCCDFHKSHQSNLVRKDKPYYEPQFPDVADNLEYVWPATKS